MMVVRFWIEHDTKPTASPLKNLSKHEVTFTTDKTIRMDQKIKVAVCKVDSEDHAACTMPVIASVSRVKFEDGKNTVTAHFISKGSEDFDLESRRKYERIPVKLDGRYKQIDRKEYSTCRVTDISRNGACFITRTPVKELAEVELMVLPTEGGPLAHMLHVNMIIMRCIHLGKSNYEIGGKFIVVSPGKDKSSEV
ncbi:MAG: PilZ domain-containing protein [Planctomycetota bacterium]|jgi:hypothetical protein